LRSVSLPLAASTLGRRLGDLSLHALAVQVVSVRRADGRVVPPEDALELQGGDTLVLSGLPETLTLAEAQLLTG
jgi:CPA2 family monovalent cation:H+ antiporter-2